MERIKVAGNARAVVDAQSSRAEATKCRETMFYNLPRSEHSERTVLVAVSCIAHLQAQISARSLVASKQ